MSLILMVCTGNLCRSPMAAGLLQQRLARKGLDGGYTVRSAGTWALEDRPASEHAEEVMAERGVDIAGHRAHSLAAADVAEADLVLVMSREHEQMIANTWPQYRWKVHRLSEIAGKRRDVEDPYGLPIEEYRACADVIDGYLERGFERILELA
ncbi:MAG: low molecular weight protein arginine phosphatase [Chloroflexi bacterium]|nr:MAG: low molecular weight protein arginine phosphatase [Chloroflexota bacterium]